MTNSQATELNRLIFLSLCSISKPVSFLIVGNLELFRFYFPLKVRDDQFLKKFTKSKRGSMKERENHKKGLVVQQVGR